MLEKAQRTGYIRLVRLADGGAIDASSVAIEPARWHRVAADGDFAPGDLVGQIELPAEETELRVDVADLVVAPAGTGGLIVGDGHDVVGIGIAGRHRVRIGGVDEGGAGDGRVAAGQGVAEGACAEDSDIPDSVGQCRRYLGDAVADPGRRLGEAAVRPAVGDLRLADIQFRVAADRCHIHLPGDLVDGYVDPVGAVTVSAAVPFHTEDKIKVNGAAPLAVAGER